MFIASLFLVVGTSGHTLCMYLFFVSPNLEYGDCVCTGTQHV